MVTTTFEKYMENRTEVWAIHDKLIEAGLSKDELIAHPEFQAAVQAGQKIWMTSLERRQKRDKERKMQYVFKTKDEKNGTPNVVALLNRDRTVGLTLAGGQLAAGRMLTFGSNMAFAPDDWVRLEQTDEHAVSGKCIECNDPIDIITKYYDDDTTLTLRRSCACMKSPQRAARAIFQAKADLIF